MTKSKMKLVADESCDFAVVRALRDAGMDVLAIAEVSPTLTDIEVLKIAAREGAILLTEDKDFGDWVFAHRESVESVVLMRFPGAMRKQMARAAVEIISEHGSQLKGSFVVLEPGRARIRGI
ncbi:MAG: hypothetical protein COZ70_01515 [Deltaproteobacteria bacterium CG_4_8_14_3_um_filter_51_11]|nr:MAG: hypothetical protein COZ70_01515 [Deltaproteobacteria bacterium CG_4_8_14_3_um_filter_51_11]